MPKKEEKERICSVNMRSITDLSFDGGGVSVCGGGVLPLSSSPIRLGTGGQLVERGALRAARGTLVSGRRWWWALLVVLEGASGGNGCLIMKELFEAVQNLAGSPAGGSSDCRA